MLRLLVFETSFNIFLLGARHVKKHENTRYLTKRAMQSVRPEKQGFLSWTIIRWCGMESTCCSTGRRIWSAVQDEVDTVAGIIPAVKKDHPQMLLLDLNLKDGNSFGIIGTLRDQFPDVPILVISQFDNIHSAEDALHAGAVGYVMKEKAAQEILTAIRAVLRKETYISHKLEPLRLPARPRPDDSSGLP